MKTIKGDLIKLTKNGDFNVIIHGCNCFCTMGAGIAKQIKKNFPEAYEADLKTKKGDRNKLGTWSNSKIRDLLIFNAYTQFNYGRNQRQVNYDAIQSAFKSIAVEVKKICNEPRIGYPAIGAGYGGGDWRIISKIIDKEFDGLDHTFVHLI